MTNIVIVGASRGLGLGIAQGLPVTGDNVWILSRTEPAALDRKGVRYEWIPGDISTSSSYLALEGALKGSCVDIVIYCAAIRENVRDIAEYSYEKIHEVIAVNLAGFLCTVKGLSPNLEASRRANVIAISSTAGLGYYTGTQIAYASAKSGMRAAAQALRQQFRRKKIAVTVISPGGLASDVDYSSNPGIALERHHGTRIPTQDILELIKAIRKMSPATCVLEVVMPAMLERGV